MNSENTQPGDTADESEFRTVVYHVEHQGHTALHKRAAQQQPALLMVQGEHPGRIFRLKRGSNAIGRDTACEITVGERAASRRHAELRWENDTTIIEDLNSTNGTLLNSTRIAAPVVLRAGNLIKIGACVFRYLDSLLDVETLESMHARGTTDQLTGAYNKAHLLKTLATAIELAKSGPPLCLIGMDLDHFKKVNDTHGHLAGDLVLKESARLIKALIRPEDILGRFGGEEFFVILPGCKLETAVAIAERIRANIAAHTFEFSGVKIPVTISLGVCSSSSGVATATAMFALADELLYRSKREGRNRVTAA